MGKYTKSWEEFLENSAELLYNDPVNGKVHLKYNNKLQKAIIKVTNHKKILLFKLQQKDDFKKIDEFIKISSKILSNNQQEETMQEEQ